MHISVIGIGSLSLALIATLTAIVLSLAGSLQVSPRFIMISNRFRRDMWKRLPIPAMAERNSTPTNEAIQRMVFARNACIRMARISIMAVAGFLLLAIGALVASFLVHDFGLAYVYNQSNLETPWYYVMAAVYGGQEGSLLYWACTLAIFSVIVALAVPRRLPKLAPVIFITLMCIELFLIGLLLTISSPFVRLPKVPADGLGLNPLLLDPGMLIHPPTLLLGYMSFAIPFAFAIAALITGELDIVWLTSIRRWMLTSWTIQTAGLVLGAWWAYHVLGWGGYWGWDPVENAALLPWLTATAFLHSTMVQERRGVLKKWNVVLVLASFLLSIFGTFEVRSGIVSSVHSFAESDIGPYFLALLCLCLLVSVGICIYRLPMLRSENTFVSIVSREGAFLLNNLLLTGIAFAILWGTLFPLISQAVMHQTMTVGAPFYDRVNGPLFLVLLLAMGISPLLAWRYTPVQRLLRAATFPLLSALAGIVALLLAGIMSPWAVAGFAFCIFALSALAADTWQAIRLRHAHGEVYGTAILHLLQKNRRRYGGYLVHVGFLLLALGVIGSHFFQTEQDATLVTTQSVSIGQYTLKYLGNIDSVQANSETLTAQLELLQGSTVLQYVYPSRTIYDYAANQPVSGIPIVTRWFTDLYIYMGDWQGASQVTLRVFINPLVPLVWLGGSVMVLGGWFCWLPSSLPKTKSELPIAVEEKDGVPDPTHKEAVLA